MLGWAARITSSTPASVDSGTRSRAVRCHITAQWNSYGSWWLPKLRRPQLTHYLFDEGELVNDTQGP
jgi:hypothetical protein